MVRRLVGFVGFGTLLGHEQLLDGSIMLQREGGVGVGGGQQQVGAVLVESGRVGFGLAIGLIAENHIQIIVW